MKTILLIAMCGFFFILITKNLNAQTSVHGVVQMTNGNPLANANVLLLNAKDSSLVKGEISKTAGTFAFENITAGSYIIDVSYAGFEKLYLSTFNIQKNENKNVGAITLREASATLATVQVQARKPFLEQKIDRLVINVASSITSAGNTALEVLERSPGIVVDHQNNTIAMNGKDGVVVMINGKINYMPVSAVIQLLNGMSANNIERIELITTPPANLDAEGNAGYINIVLKQNNNTGTNGSYSLTLGYGRGPITEASVNINHRKGRINVYGDVSYSRVKKPLPVSGYSAISNNDTLNETYLKANRHDTTRNINGRFGLDWQINKKTIAGILLSGYDNMYTQAEHNISAAYKNGSFDTLTHLDNSEMNHWYNYGVNINLQRNFNETDKLAFNADYIYYYNNQPVNYHSSYYNATGEYIYDDVFRSGKKTPINFWVGSVDFSKKISKNISVDAGIKQTISSFHNDISFERIKQNAWIKDDSLSANYKLKEDYSAVYASFNITINENTEAKAGLRYEHTNSNLGTEDKKNIVDRHYSNFFPSVFLSHKLNEKSSINLSYSRRITRPTLNDLAPFTYYSNSNTLLTGNPSLQPSFSDNFKADYSFKNYLLSLSWSVEHNAIAGFQPHSDSVTNKIVLSAENLINQKTAAMVIVVPLTITKWWYLQASATGIWQQTNALYKGETLSFNQSNININANMRFTLPKNCTAEITGSYQSTQLFGIYKLKPYGSLDIGIRKKLPGKWGSFIFNAADILSTSVFDFGTNYPKQNLVTNIRIQFSMPSFKLTYTHSFGNDKLKEKRDRTTGAEDEAGRVHN